MEGSNVAHDVHDEEKFVTFSYHPPYQMEYRVEVGRVIEAMRADEVRSLQEMAEIAYLSPYHFARIFREVTGISPGEFVSALRLQRAKEMLLTTDLSASEVCFEVGYKSLGTFSTRFAQLVGVPPSQIRRLPEELASRADAFELGEHELGPSLASSTRLSSHGSPRGPENGITGRVIAPEASNGGRTLIFVGLFAGAIPQRRPAAGVVLSRPGTYHIQTVPPTVPNGLYHLMAAALPDADDPIKLLLPGDAVRVGRAESTVMVHGGRVTGPVQTSSLDIVLRPMQITDPPVLVSLFGLVARQLSSSRPPKSKVPKTAR